MQSLVWTYFFGFTLEFSGIFQSLLSTFTTVSIGKGLSSFSQCPPFRRGVTPNPVEAGAVGGDSLEEQRARDGEERKQRLWRREAL